MSLVVEPLSSAITAEAPDVAPEAPAPAPAPVPAPAPQELTAEERIWASRTRRLARSASRAARLVPGVAAADFTITGTPERPSLTLSCTLRPEAKAAVVMEHIENTVVGDLELLLGVPFAERHLEYSVDRG